MGTITYRQFPVLFVNRHILCDTNVQIMDGCRNFDAVVKRLTTLWVWTPGWLHGRFTSNGHCLLKFMETIVGPLWGASWIKPWKDFFHLWNKWVAGVMQWCGVNTWSHRCLEQHWRLGMYVANLLKNRWVCRALAWVPVGRHVLNFLCHT